MAKRREVDRVAEAIGSIVRQLQICREIAEALIETGQSPAEAAAAGQQTEHDLFRSKVTESVMSLARRLNEVRHDALRPDIIRAVAHLREIGKSCRECPHVNALRLREGKPFRCRTARLLRRSGPQGFHFRLDEHGRIIELQ